MQVHQRAQGIEFQSWVWERGEWGGRGKPEEEGNACPKPLKTNLGERGGCKTDSYKLAIRVLPEISPYSGQHKSDQHLLITRKK